MAAGGLHSLQQLSRKDRKSLYAPVKPARKRKKRREEEKTSGPGRLGWDLPGSGQTSVVVSIPEFRGPTVQVCGLYPFSVGSSLALVGAPLGQHLEGRGVVCGDPVSWFVAGLINNPSAFVLARPGVGKALDVDTVIPTPAGYARMGDLKPGDYVYGSDGRSTPVVAVSEVMTDRECFELEFSTGERIVADAEHLWVTSTRNERKARTYPVARPQYGSEADLSAVEVAGVALASTPSCRVRDVTRALGWAGTPREHVVYRLAARVDQVEPGRFAPVALLERLDEHLRAFRNDQRHKAASPIKTTREIASTLTVNDHTNHAVRVARIEGEQQDLAVGPYTLGAWLGDGTSSAAVITGVDEEVFEQIRAEGYEVRPRSAPMAFGIGISGVRPVRGAGTLQQVLRELGVLNNKHIPAQYLRAPAAARRRLLAGLLDTDGTVNPQGAAEFYSTCKRLAEDVHELVASLGYRPSMRAKMAKLGGREISLVWTVGFTPHDDVFGLSRKSFALSARRRPGSTTSIRTRNRFIVGARPVVSRPVRCIQVAAEDGMFLAGRSFIATHNSSLVRHIGGYLPYKGVLPIILSDWKPDYVDLVKELDGQVITVGRSAGYVNPLDPGPLAGMLDSLPEAVRARVVSNMRGRRINVMEALCGLALGSQLEAHERTLLSAALEYWDQTQPGVVPVMADILAVVQAKPERLRTLAQDRGEDDRYLERTQRLVDALIALNGGSETFGRVFAEPTTVPLKLDRAVVFDLSEFEDMAPALQAGVQLVCWSYGSTAVSTAKALADAGLAPRRSYLLIMDELWRALRAAPFMVDRVDEITRLNRTLNLGQILITHGMDDLKVHDEEATAKAWGFVARSEMVFMGGLNPGEMGNLEEVFALSQKEKDMLTSWADSGEVNPMTGQAGIPRGRGKFLMKVGKKSGIPFMVDLTPVETESGVHDTSKAWADTAAAMHRSNSSTSSYDGVAY